MIDPHIKTAANNLKMVIEQGNLAQVERHVEELKLALYGYTPLREMTPEGRLLYLLALLIAHPST